MLQNTSSDFISDMEVIDHRHYDRQHRKQNGEYSSS